MFSGLTSRWTMPAAWAAASASATCRPTSSSASRQRPRAMHAPQRLPVDELLDDEVARRRRLADFVDRDDVRVVQRRGGAGLAEEALDSARGVAGAVRAALEGDPRLSRVSRGAEDLAHAAAADHRFDAVVIDGR